MAIFGGIFLSMLSSLGVTLAVLEFVRTCRAKRMEFVCLCFREELLNENEKPDMLIICKTESEQEEIIRRVCDGDSRKVYIKRW